MPFKILKPKCVLIWRSLNVNSYGSFYISTSLLPSLSVRKRAFLYFFVTKEGKSDDRSDELHLLLVDNMPF